jgi:hypothetical protein
LEKVGAGRWTGEADATVIKNPVILGRIKLL